MAWSRIHDMVLTTNGSSAPRTSRIYHLLSAIVNNIDVITWLSTDVRPRSIRVSVVLVVVNCILNVEMLEL